MGNKLSKFATVSLHERIQWTRAKGDEGVVGVKSYPVDEVLLTRDPGPMPFTFAEAINQCQPPFPRFNAKQMGGLKEVFVEYAIKHWDNDFQALMMELAVKMKGDSSMELIKDRFCALVLWITLEEKRNSQLHRLINSAAAQFLHGAKPKDVTTVAKTLLAVDPSKTCAYRFCPSGCVLEHSYTCIGCGVVTYCSTDCQKAAWETHKEICRIHQNCNSLRACRGKSSKQLKQVP